MKCPKNWQNCKICEEDKGLWHSVWNDLKEVIVSAKWDELKFIGIALVVGYILLGWIGAIIFFFLCKMLANVQGGTQLYTPGTPKIEFRDCPLGHKDCQFKARKIWN